MKTNAPTIIFGEALFDCFPDGEQNLGGAPFNVAWHLHALGDQPVFISRIGDDELGWKLLSAMHHWGMDTHSIQLDPVHPTGQVEVTLIKNEPHYTITLDCAYDFISEKQLENLPDHGILYHGTLGLRNNTSRNGLAYIAQQPDLSIFLDVNLRSPWWQKQQVYDWMKQARWVKMNEDELQQLGFVSTEIDNAMATVVKQFQLEHLIVTQGEKGANVLTADGKFYQETPTLKSHIVDTVGAGDAFSALYIHGLKKGWSIIKTLNIAQQFAGNVVGIRGATTNQLNFYHEYLQK